MGQLKALYYVKKEGPVVYYTEESGKQIKLVKSTDDGKFYKVDTKTGEPVQGLKHIDKSKVLVGAKGFNEQIGTQDLGEKIAFGHLKEATINATSDQAVTGAQLNSVKDVLGVNLKDNKLDKHPFNAVNYIDDRDTGAQNTFKDVINELITAVNKGYKFSDGSTNHINKDTPFYLGSTIEIKSGDITKKNGAITEKYFAKNLKTEFKSENENSKSTFTIGLKEDPEFKTVTVTEKVGDNSPKSTLTTKEYVDEKLSNVAAKFTVKGIRILTIKKRDIH